MPMTVTRKKTLRFDMLTVGDKYEDPEVTKLTGDPTMVYRKTSSRKAILDGDANADEFAVKPSHTVRAFVTVDEPTPEEKDAAHLRQVTMKLEDWTATSKNAVATMKVQLDRDPVYAVTGYGREIVEHIMRGRVAAILQNVILGDGIDKARAIALDKTLASTRNPTFSSNPMSNLADQYAAAAWAEFATDEAMYLKWRNETEEV